MTLQTRILLLVTLLLFLAVAITSGVLSWNARQTFLAQAERNAESVARLLAYSAAFARDVPDEVEELVSEQMLTEAAILAHFVAVVEKGRLGTAEIQRILTEIVAATDLDEILVTDEAGHAYLNTVPGVDFTFLADPRIQPQASVFYPLLTGEATEVTQEVRVRETDDKVVKYADVTGVDKPRIVQVGHEFGYVEGLRRRFGLGRLLPYIMRGGGVDAVWVLDDKLRTLAHDSLPGIDMPGRPPEADRAHILDVIEQARTDSAFTGDLLKVAAPIIQRDGVVSGAVFAYFPLTDLEETLARNAWLSVAVSVAVLLLGLSPSIFVGRRLTRPVTEISAAAHAFEGQRFDPASLARTRERRDELGNLARVFTRMAAEVQARTDHLDRLVDERTHALNEKNVELETTLRRIEEELAMAQRMQLSILPRQLPQHAGVTLFARMMAAREVGGDFYDVFDIDEDRIGIVIADVSGKGMPAALFMAVSSTVIKSVANRRRPPAQVMARANDILCEGNDAAMFVPVFYGIANIRTGELVYANAGHNAPYLIGADGEVAPLQTTGGVALGVMKGLDYEERAIMLGDGDTVFCFTDGITETFDESGHEFSDAALRETLRDASGLAPEALGEAVIGRVQEFAGAAPQFDDITCLVLRRNRLNSAAG